MSSSGVWPCGMPEVGQKAQRSREVSSRDIELETRVLLTDGKVVLDGSAVCYTMPLPAEE